MTTKEVTTDYSSGSNNKDFTKKRLVAFYGKYNPEKLNSVDEMLTKWSGREEEMFRKLEKKYGDNVTEVWLTAFYAKYNKDRVSSVDPMMEKYKGDEETMFIKLTTKYKDPPLVIVVEKEKENKDPAAATGGSGTIATADTTKSSSANGDDDVFVNPKTGGAMPPASSSAASDTAGKPCKSDECANAYECNKQRITDFYKKHDPSKVDSVDDILKKYEGDEDTLFDKLNKKYNDPPKGLMNSTTGKPCKSDECESAYECNKGRIIRYYTIHNPSRIDNVDNLLKKYEGKEEDLFRTLQEKYGGEGPQGLINSYTGEEIAVYPEVAAALAATATDTTTAGGDDAFDAAFSENNNVAGGGGAATAAVAAVAVKSLDDDDHDTPPAPKAAAIATGPYASGSTNKDFNKKRLVATYEKHNPDKVKNVDKLLKKYEGDECAMLEKLEENYGENPTAIWLTAFYTKYKPDRVSSVDTLMQKYKGREEEMFITLTNKYNDPSSIVDLDTTTATTNDDANVAAATPTGLVGDSDAAPAAAVATTAVVGATAAAAATKAPRKEATGPYASGSTNKDFNKKRLVAVYKKHSPKRLENVDKVLKQYEGDECAMLEQLEESYGENPTAVWLTAFYLKYKPDRVSTVDSLLEQYEGKEAEMFIKLTKKYNDPSIVEMDVVAATAATGSAGRLACTGTTCDNAYECNKERLVDFYTKYNPDKVDCVDDMLKKYEGNEEELFVQLQTKYRKGPDGLVNSITAKPCTGENCDDAYECNKKRLSDFYTKNNPGKLDEVDDMLKKYEGNEEKLFGKLEAKYSAKPSITKMEANPGFMDVDDGTEQREFVDYSRTAVYPEVAAFLAATTTTTTADDGDTSAGAYSRTAVYPEVAAFLAATTTTTTADDSDDTSAGAATANAAAAAVAVKSRGLSTDTAPVPTGPYASGCTNKDFNKKRLMAVYKKHNPDKVKNVDKLLKKYEGDECAMLEKLEENYGDNPTAVWLTAFYTKYNKDRVSSVEPMMEKYKGREEDMFIKLTTKYNDPTLLTMDGEPCKGDKCESAYECNKKRISDFYMKHDPEKIDTIDDTLKQYEGNEEELFSKLNDTYGDKPRGGLFNSVTGEEIGADNDVDATTAVAATTAVVATAAPTKASRKEAIGPYASGCTNKDFNKKRLIAVYSKHSPKRLENVDKVLTKYEGDECAMLEQLEDSYGDNPTAVWLTAFYSKYKPDRVSSVDSMMRKYEGQEEEMFINLTTKYNDPPIVAATAAAATGAGLACKGETCDSAYECNKERLSNFYMKYNPENVDCVDDMLKKYEGNEEELFVQLQDKYSKGPEGLVNSMTAKPCTGENCDCAYECNKKRLSDFYRKNNPEKLEEVDDVLKVYEGNEEELFGKLEAKYSAKPSVTKMEENPGFMDVDEIERGLTSTPPSTDRGLALNSVAPKRAPSPTTVASEYHLKMVELVNDVEEGKQELQAELAQEHGPYWAEDEEVVFKYMTTVKMMTDIKLKEINGELDSRNQLDRVIIIDELPECQGVLLETCKKRDEFGDSIYSGYGDDYQIPEDEDDLLAITPRTLVQEDSWRKYYVRKS